MQELTGWESLPEKPVEIEITERADEIRAAMQPNEARKRDMAEYDPTAMEWYKRWSNWRMNVDMGRKKSYEGTVPKAEIAKRRAANKVAAESRRKNR